MYTMLIWWYFNICVSELIGFLATLKTFAGIQTKCTVLFNLKSFGEFWLKSSFQLKNQLTMKPYFVHFGFYLKNKKLFNLPFWIVIDLILFHKLMWIHDAWNAHYMGVNQCVVVHTSKSWIRRKDFWFRLEILPNYRGRKKTSTEDSSIIS